MTYKERLEAIRSQMKGEGISAYIIPSADPHISEYVPDRYKCIEFASGFTGSAGTLVITDDFAGLWTDARYFVQANEQLAGTGFELVKLQVQHAPEYIDWLAERLPEGATVAFDAKLISVGLALQLEAQLVPLGLRLNSNRDYLEPIWHDRPDLPAAPAFLLSEDTVGESTESKLERLRTSLKKHRADYHLISSLDDMAWLFNMRGADVKCNPVVLSFALISQDKAMLFVDTLKLSEEDQAKLKKAGVELETYDMIERAVSAIPADSILIDSRRNCYALYKQLPQEVRVIQETNPTTFFKAVKNEVEIANTRKTMIKDGVALTRFFKWLEENIGKTRITELTVVDKVREFRAAQEGFVGESFDTISGYKAHGALPHYRVTPASDIELQAEGLFLVDSGGQYNTGTTDITRVVSLGNLTEEESIDYTLVLKGMIDGATARYPKGTCGYQIDAISRKPLWDYARNYGHGTGHGVGFFLNVHEGPHVLNPSPTAVPLALGMISSVEPGIYRTGKHGIRIENLVLTVQDESNEFGEFYTFEHLTMALIDTTPVKKDLLAAHQIKWLNEYHQQVVAQLGPHLSEDELSWLKEKAKPI
ncbi:Xaa-Pro aminopeptidase [Pontibacter ummariensis]|uniref:Xaa-Pro aminopeptidase n=1 Tax=Pontibacter ummariensis TaxID=1610492 RepID=A0A239GHB1_9BACT|nr:aminopeptidase P family protein [Pontibacter ummariensis]PRY11269.1 Xaa-Pro aminopeptidase [Pontibacter ummariensis]SNS68529.1 Xaa-Pro aminopeptidase [Pontibacter ummariensis]